jgi:3-oxoacyl-[acyl-carrier protein] reductase
MVTGASRGIGRGIAAAFRAAGDDVTVTARSTEALDQVVAELGPDGTLAVPGDVTRLADLDAAAAAAAERFGGVDVLCHNAGSYPIATIEDATVELWDEVLRSNLTSAFLAVKACAPYLRAGGGGRIVLISSITGPRVGYPGLSHYGAAKAGMLGFMRTAALELAPDRITVNAIEPGSIVTESQAELSGGAAAERVRHIPVGHRGSPKDIAAAVLYLASPEARFVTGQTVVVDGGQLLPEWPA